jgi:hypothetical protein
MEVADFDENGWARGVVAPLPPREAWTLLSPEPDARVDAARWAHQADAFFGARLVVPLDKRYPSGTLPLADRVAVDVGEREATAPLARVWVVTVPLDRAPEALAAARAGVLAIGGAGFEALIPRARRVWQVHDARDVDPRAPLLVAAVLASLLLAPIVPPEGGAIFGVKGARERLARLTAPKPPP